jgi:hypothetical protein
VCQRQKHPVHLLEGGRRLSHMHAKFLAVKLILSKPAKRAGARRPDVLAARRRERAGIRKRTSTTLGPTRARAA